MDTSYILLLLCCLFLVSFSLTKASVRANITEPASIAIQQACKATLHPDECESMILATRLVKPGSNSSNIIMAALMATAEHLKAGQDMVKTIPNVSTTDKKKLSHVVDSCLEGLFKSEYRASSVIAALVNRNLRDARTWTSAALSHQTGCLFELKNVTEHAPTLNSTMTFFENTLIVSTSNVLNMLWALDVRGPDTESWITPHTERDGFWEPVVFGSGGTELEFNFTGLVANVTVCKDGSGECYETVQEAVDAAPQNLERGKRFIIKIKEGVYEEHVKVSYEKNNLVFIGDGMGKTIITGDLNVGLMRNTTYRSATVGISGDGFMASGLTIQNIAGPNASQAVAFRSNSDLSLIENCEFLGNQDTLYVHSLRQIYKSCRIEGNVDFIFGNGAAIFQNCTILIRPRQVNPEKGEKNAITAQGRTDPAQNTGFVFLGCIINGTEDYMNLYQSNPNVHKSYLGRPWKMYSRTIYINCTMEKLISPEGWMPWDEDFALNTLFYGEFGNSGAGSNRSNRVPWSSYIPKHHVSTYYAHNFLQGEEWRITTTF